jgi:threonine dehydrogenase-like Zn-dependent dehydrogenase
MLGAERVIAIDRFDYRLRMAREKAGAETINYEEVNVHDALKEMTGGRGPDAASTPSASRRTARRDVRYDRAKQAMMLETDRPVALREAILACRSGGTVSVVGVYGGFVDKFPMGAIVNRSLTIKAGQCHVHRYMRPLLERIRGRHRPQLRHHAPHAARPGVRGLRDVQPQAGRLPQGSRQRKPCPSPSGNWRSRGVPASSTSRALVLRTRLATRPFARRV